VEIDHYPEVLPKITYDLFFGNLFGLMQGHSLPPFGEEFRESIADKLKEKYEKLDDPAKTRNPSDWVV